MKNKLLILIIIGLLLITGTAMAHDWYPSAGYLRPSISSWGLQIPALVGGVGICSSVDANGVFSTTTCGTAGTDLDWTMTGADLYASTSATAIGIGLTTPTSTLDIKGSAGLDLFRISSSTGDRLLTVNQSGDVNMQDGNFLNLSNTTTSSISYSSAHGNILIGGDGYLATVGQFRIASNTNIDAGGNWEPSFDFNAGGSVAMSNTSQGVAGAKYFQIDMSDGTRFTTGNVSIGTTTATAKLDVKGESGQTPFNVANVSGVSLFRIMSTGNIGIATTNPAYKLDIYGTAGTNPFNIASSTGTTLMTVLQNGNVGIGTSSPDALLDIVGGDILLDNAQQIQWRNSVGTVLDLLDLDNANTFVIGDSSASFADLNFDTGNKANAIKIKNTTGYVGIDTVDPDRKLDILDASAPQLRLTHTDGSVYVDMQASSTGNLYINPSGGGVGIGTDDLDANTALHTLGVYNVFEKANNDPYLILRFSGNPSAGSPIGRIQFQEDTTTRTYIQAETSSGNQDQGELTFGTNNEKMRITYSGNIGIATTSPQTKLDIWGTAGTDPFNVASSTGTSLFRITQAGNIGIATSTPLSSSSLDVYGDIMVSGPNRYLNFNSIAGSGGYGIRDNSGTMEYKSGAGWTAIGSGGGGSPDLDWTMNGTDLYASTSATAIGIGMTTPTSTLDIKGTAGLDLLRISSSTGTSIFRITQQGNIISASSTDWQTAYQIVNASSTNWQTTTRTMNSSSSDWQSAFQIVNASSTNWQSTTREVNSSSTEWETAYAYSQDPYTGGDYLTLTGKDFDLDIEIYSHMAAFSIFDATTTKVASSTAGHFPVPYASTITKIGCECGIGTSTVQLDERAWNKSRLAGTDILSTALECASSTASSTTFANATIAQNAWVNLDIDGLNQCDEMTVFVFIKPDD